MRPTTLMICVLSTTLLAATAGAAIRPSTASLGGRLGDMPSFIPTGFHPGVGNGWGHSGGDRSGGHDHGNGWGWGGGGWRHGGHPGGWDHGGGPGGGHPCSP